ncbi:DEAD/DEAH box helicase [Cavenderia fasciculata]|uniref:DEAD/DEAH box helicase n=1 Tax=Cavenderia fasciculata TaxID=261658 RepID=F4PGF1_CACFS|nr:DEAD/DEAH box helicase [Cavenderia fasciculata]EGG24785.1 DEAD/DEAH box helicase [Cavenderia fasciculata]|eukprot:XP_004362636.1 DEAD/DEAH box helicase [Cavenderia fasciculata]
MVLNKGSTLPTTISDYLRFPQSQQQSTTTTTDYIKLDELVAHRNSLYQKKKEEKKRAAGVKLLSGQLAWGYFSNDKLSAGEQKQNRATYNKFLDIIMKFVDNDEIPSDELHAASYEVFMMLGNPDKDDVFKQQSLKQLFGSGFKLNLYAALKQHVDQLLTVKNPYQANSAGAREASAIINDTDSQEWGNSFIKLNSVDELFIDIPYQNQEELDMQQEAASASMSSKKEEEIFIVKKTSKKQPQQRQPQQQPQQQQSQKSKFNDQWLIEKCLDTLKASKNIEEDLINILGFDHLDFVGDLVTNKSSVLHAIQNPTTTVKQQVTGKEKQSSNSKKGGQQNNKNDLYDAEEFEQFIPNPKQNIPANLQPQTEFKGKDLNVDAAMFSKVALPSNLIKKECGTHTEMTIPHSKPKPFAENEKLIPITDIDKRSRAAFGKIQSLNRIQSRVFDVAYKTNENLLICAPTGAVWKVVGIPGHCGQRVDRRHAAHAKGAARDTDHHHHSRKMGRCD